MGGGARRAGCWWRGGGGQQQAQEKGRMWVTTVLQLPILQDSFLCRCQTFFTALLLFVTALVPSCCVALPAPLFFCS